MENISQRQVSPDDPKSTLKDVPQRQAMPAADVAEDFMLNVLRSLSQSDPNTPPPEFTNWLVKPGERRMSDTLHHRFAPLTPLPSVIYLGLSTVKFIKSKKDWMLDISKTDPELLQDIKDSFEQFMGNVEWEDE